MLFIPYKEKIHLAFRVGKYLNNLKGYFHHLWKSYDQEFDELWSFVNLFILRKLSSSQT